MNEAMQRRLPAAIATIAMLALLAGCGGKGGGGEDADSDADAEADTTVDSTPDGDAADSPGDGDAEEDSPIDAADADAGEDAEDGDAIVPPGGTIEAMTATLPTALGGIAAATDGTVAWIFGGVYGAPPDNAVDTIIEFDPVADTATTLSSVLPFPTFLNAAEWDGSAVYVLGGTDGSALTDAIWRFDPSDDSVTAMTATLPAQMARLAAAWDGTAIRIFGGNTGGYVPTGFSAMIASYDTTGDALAASASTLPGQRASRIGAIHCSSRMLVVGGWGTGGKLDQILEYDPVTDAVTVLDTHLVVAQDGGALACDGRYVYLFGGESDTATLSTIYRFDTETDGIELLTVALPSPTRGLAAVWIGTSAYLFGGNRTTGISNAILRFTPD